MSNKSKGSNAERELVRMCTKHGWRALRVAGSGVNDDSPCDIIIGKLGRKAYAIEAKSSKKTAIYITKSQINDFVLFGMTMGMIPVIAVRFNYQGWLFLEPSMLIDSGKNWVVHLKIALQKGKRFGQFFEDKEENFD
jgi:Holliday junction resolvase